jgi:hypothetical protein
MPGPVRSVSAAARRRAAVAVPVLMLLAAGTPSGARAQWSAPVDLSLPGTLILDPQVAVAPSGATVAAWVSCAGSDAIAQARRIAADGTLGPILDLSQAGRRADDPDVAMDAAGNATVVWSDRGQTGTEEIVRARRITATGALEPTVSRAPACPPHCRSRGHARRCGRGGVVAPARHRPSAPHRSRRRTGGDSGRVADELRPVRHGGRRQRQCPHRLGHVRRHRPAHPCTARGCRRRAHPTVTLSDGDQLSFTLQVALDATGLPTVTWLPEDASIELRRSLAGGGLGPTVTVAPGGAATGARDLAVDTAGNATIAWRGQSGSSQAVFLRRVPTSGSPGPIGDLWSGGDDGDPQLALDGAGVPTLIWPHSAAAGSTIRTRTAPPAAPGPIADLWPASTDALSATRGSPPTPAVKSRPSGAVRPPAASRRSWPPASCPRPRRHQRSAR